MNLAARISSWWAGKEKALHLSHGLLGERAARRQLRRQGLKFLTANFRSARGEIDLIMRDGDCPQFEDIDVNFTFSFCGGITSPIRLLARSTANDTFPLVSTHR